MINVCRVRWIVCMIPANFLMRNWKIFRTFILEPPIGIKYERTLRHRHELLIAVDLTAQSVLSDLARVCRWRLHALRYHRGTRGVRGDPWQISFAESSAAESTDDFIHKISVSLKEAEETQFWLGCVRNEFPELDEASKLETECHEFVKILQSSLTTAKRNRDRKAQPACET